MSGTMTARFEGKTALVTGAASGIGRATALRLAAEGAAVAVVDRDGDGALVTLGDIEAAGGRAGRFLCDVSDAGQVAETVAAAERALGPIDVLANVAGVVDAGESLDIEAVADERWHRVLAINLSGPFYMCRAVLPGMAGRGRGAIVNVSSLAGRSKSAAGGPAYTSSKAGLLGLTRHLAFDYGPRGIRVNAICPGGVDTPMARASTASLAATPEKAEEFLRRASAYQFFMPIKRLSTAEEQAAAVVFLASDDAAYINGVSLDVNGGLFMA